MKIETLPDVLERMGGSTVSEIAEELKIEPVRAMELLREGEEMGEFELINGRWYVSRGEDLEPERREKQLKKAVKRAQKVREDRAIKAERAAQMREQLNQKRQQERQDELNRIHGLGLGLGLGLNQVSKPKSKSKPMSVSVSASTLPASAMPLTHSELCKIAAIFLRREGFKVVFDERMRTDTQYGERPDAIGFRKGVSCLIEVKCTRRDFLSDKKKKFRIAPEKGMGDWRFYLSYPGVIEPSDLPEGWGLLHVAGGKIVKVCGWKDGVMWLRSEKKPFKANKLAESQLKDAALIRVDIRGHLDGDICSGFDEEKLEEHKERQQELFLLMDSMLESAQRTEA